MPSPEKSMPNRLKLRHGEIVSLDGSGKSQFRDLLFHRVEPLASTPSIYFWIDGEDRRHLPLVERKSLILVPSFPDMVIRLLYCDHIEADGEGLFRLASSGCSSAT